MSQHRDDTQESLRRIEDQILSLRNDLAADRLITAKKIVELEQKHDSLAGKVKIYVSVAIAALSVGAAMLWDWVKHRLGMT